MKGSEYKIPKDRIYPRCPVCKTEIYGPAVIQFSQGKFACQCGHRIPEFARLVK